MRREESLEKTPILGKIEGKERRGQRRMRWLDSVLDAANMSLSRLWERVEDMGPWCDVVHGATKSPRHDLATEQQLNLHEGPGSCKLRCFDGGPKALLFLLLLFHA